MIDRRKFLATALGAAGSTALAAPARAALGPARVDLPRIRDAAWSLQKGGVGFYPRSQFVHADVGRVRRW